MTAGRPLSAVLSSSPELASGEIRRFGLTQEEAGRRLAQEGPNELPRRGRRPMLAILFLVLREPMLLLLIAGGLVYLALGDRAEALMLIIFSGFSVGVTVIQETRSERALAALRDLATPHAIVIRDGERRRIPSRDLVRDDLVVLAEGDRACADGWIVENDGLVVDESLLTGESVPATKALSDRSSCEAPASPGEGAQGYIYSGTLIVRGTGLSMVNATGLRTEVGRIGQSLSEIETVVSPLYREMRFIVFTFGLIATAVCGLAVLLFGLLRGGWLDAGLAGIALAMSMLPEEIPVVLTVFMAMGALRMSRVHVLARRAAAIETMGSATVLCTDKTGTLTENRMRLAELQLPDGRVFAPDQMTAPPDDFWAIVELGVLGSASEPFDPMEIAFGDLDRTHQTADLPRRRTADWARFRHYPLDPALMVVSYAWRTGPEGDYLIAAKGAPEAIIDLCQVGCEERRRIQEAAATMAMRGLRVLGVAEAHWPCSELPASQRAFRFTCRGLVGLYDPLRAGVREAVRQCTNAGIRVVMITGDHPETARVIASQAGIAVGEVVTGTMLADMDDAVFARRIGEINVFARVLPEQKLRIVEALKRAGEVVAMTGDGINDAPSLKAADIGIAMGGRGTDVAREAAAIVLLDDEFGSIVTALRLGRRIYDNLRKALSFIIAVHLPIAGLALLPLLFGYPILLGPVHIAVLQMIIDPVCSLAFEAESEEADVMRRPPRSRDARLLSLDLFGWALTQGVVILAMVMALLFWSHARGHDEQMLRAVIFVALVCVVFALVLANRSFSASAALAIRRPGTALIVVATFVVLVLCLAELAPDIGRLFGFARLSAIDAFISIGAGGAALLALEGLKLVRHTFRMPFRD